MKFLSLTLAIYVLSVAGYCQSSGFSLVGAWRSNKELSIQTIHYEVPIADELKKQLEDVFGQLQLTYTDSEITAFAPHLGDNGSEWHFKTKYKIVAEDEESLAIVSMNPLTNKEEISHIHFDGPDRYWIYIEDKGWKEFFDRLK